MRNELLGILRIILSLSMTHSQRLLIFCDRRSRIYPTYVPLGCAYVKPKK